MQDFIDDLKAVFAKHQMALLGTIRLFQIDEASDFKTDTLSVCYQKDNPLHSGITERGDFLLVDCQKREQKPVEFDSSGFQILDKEALVRGGVKSLLDDKVYYSRKDYDDHFERAGKVLVGSDFQSQTNARKDRMAERAERRRQQAAELARHG